MIWHCDKQRSLLRVGEPLQIPGLFNGRQDRQNGLHAGPGFQQELNWHEEFAGIPGGIHQGPQSQAGVAPFLQVHLSLTFAKLQTCKLAGAFADPAEVRSIRFGGFVWVLSFAAGLTIDT